MFKIVTDWLKKPYYFNKSIVFKLTLSIGLGVLVFISLLVISPAGIEEVKMNPYLFRLGYALNTTFSLLFSFFVFVKLFPDYYDNEKWTVKKHLINTFALMLFCGTLHWIYNLSVLSESHYIKYVSFTETLGYTVIIGVIPNFIYVFFNEKYRTKKYQYFSNQINKKIKTTNHENTHLTIFASNKKDSISFYINNLVYITSENNYACFFIKEKLGIKERILRVPLHNVEKNIEHLQQIFRCHKSYIINTDYVKGIGGSVKGYYFEMKEANISIPISRRFKKEQIIELIY